VTDAEAVGLLRAALDTARARGAHGIAARARIGLARRGCPDERAVESPRGPTGTERRILELSAGGLGVREVAQQLFLTPGAVQAVLEKAAAGGLKFSSSPPADPRSLATGRTP
jgi:DNA-binding NarL/FixJ family response regulator